MRDPPTISATCPPSNRLKASIAGYTLLELMFAIAVLGLLTAVALPLYKGQVDRASTSRAVSDIGQIYIEIQRYVLAHDVPPDSLNQLSIGASADPWGRPYEYLSFRTLDNNGKGKMRKDRNLVPINSEYDLYSRGPDGDSQPPLTAQPSRDDIVLANDGGYIGKADDY
ncbi:MAG TPA: prepilin-type N-terminal cleavage/methylation domain-containing protein [Steroidobacteraceae bacterium]|nr:prepilin-type N-terminal cleavage/methylation domain-containing protein [Steroidobacteraceae bacterium]